MINDRGALLATEQEVQAARRLQEATLSLHGWVPIESRNGALRAWGISHSQFGTIKEDNWNKNHGPTTAPLVMFPLPEHIHQPHHECRWSALGTMSLRRLYFRTIERGWIGE